MYGFERVLLLSGANRISTMKTLLLHFLCLAFLCFASADDLNCASTAALAGFHSKKPFFDAIATPYCNDFAENVCQGSVYTVNSEESTNKLSAGCSDQNQIIQSATIGVDNNGNPTSLSVNCCTLESTFSPSGPVVVDSTNNNQKAYCGSSRALKKIALTDNGNDQPTTVKLTCVTLASSA